MGYPCLLVGSCVVLHLGLDRGSITACCRVTGGEGFGPAYLSSPTLSPSPQDPLSALIATHEKLQARGAEARKQLNGGESPPARSPSSVAGPHNSAAEEELARLRVALAEVSQRLWPPQSQRGPSHRTMRWQAEAQKRAAEGLPLPEMSDALQACRLLHDDVPASVPRGTTLWPCCQ